MDNDTISRAALLKNPMLHTWKKKDLVEAIKTVPAVEVAPVVHGRWITMHYEGGILDGMDLDKCSACGHERIFDDVRLKTTYHYCPGCGARMDGGAT